MEGVKGDRGVSSLDDHRKLIHSAKIRRQRLPGKGTHESGAQKSQGSYENQIICHELVGLKT